MATDFATVGQKRYRTLSIEDARELSLVDERKNYRVVLQLGPMRSFRKYQPGKWELGDPIQVNQRGQKVYKPAFKPNIVETGPVTGSVTNGLISAHNQWRSDNIAQNPSGYLNRQVLVLSVTETTDVPPELMRQVGMVPTNMVQAIVEQALRNHGIGLDPDVAIPQQKRRPGRPKKKPEPVVEEPETDEE